jgi:hypothetical protein
VNRQRDELTTKRLEVAAVNEQLYKADCETRELKQRIAVSEREDREREDQKAREWESTCEDLAKELKYVQSELSQKEVVF